MISWMKMSICTSSDVPALNVRTHVSRQVSKCQPIHAKQMSVQNIRYSALLVSSHVHEMFRNIYNVYNVSVELRKECVNQPPCVCCCGVVGTDAGARRWHRGTCISQVRVSRCSMSIPSFRYLAVLGICCGGHGGWGKT